MRSFMNMAALLPLLAPALAQEQDYARNFTFDNGQILTPGLAVLNAPQPGTPMGGDTLHISLDITGSGRIPMPPYADDSPTAIHNVTMFLSSYHTGRNFTISNGTETEHNYTYTNIMLQQPDSTVKHINWIWPDCLVGDGAPDSEDSDRGLYNISIRQDFHVNDEWYYTIFDVPILVTNSIPDRGNRPSCDSLDNELIDWDDLDFTATAEIGIPFAGNDTEEIEVIPKYPEGEEGDDNGDGRFGQDVRPGDVDDGAATLGLWSGAAWVGALSVAYVLL